MGNYNRLLSGELKPLELSPPISDEQWAAELDTAIMAEREAIEDENTSGDQ